MELWARVQLYAPTTYKKKNSLLNLDTAQRYYTVYLFLFLLTRLLKRRSSGHLEFLIVQQIILLFYCVVRNNTTEYPETAAIREFYRQGTNWKKKIWLYFHNY